MNEDFSAYPVKHHDAAQIYRRCSGSGEEQSVAVDIRLSLHSKHSQNRHPVQNNS
jgi:hypothetical protein